MKDQSLISVIVPVYNADKYLEECVGSIVNQTYRNLEILLINDGSTDDSARLCDILGKKDCRIAVQHQQNAGAAAARKRGVLCASGEYICFVDADDRIDEKMVEFFAGNIGECDCITSGCYCEEEPGRFFLRVDSVKEGIYATKKELEYFLSNMIAYENRFEDGILPYLVNKMYKAEILKKVVEDIDISIRYAEDRELLFKYMLKAGKIRVSRQSFYYYRYNKESVMRTVHTNFMHDLNNLYVSLAKEFEKHPLRISLMRQLQLFIVSRIYMIPYYMGFLPGIEADGYAFPFTELKDGSRIILYGAGRVGRAYYRQIFRQRRLQMILWADKDYLRFAGEGFPVFPPEEIYGQEYDFIIIAVKSRETADEIRKALIGQGVWKEKILWRVPAVL